MTTEPIRLRHLQEIVDAWTAAELDPGAVGIVSTAVERIESIRTEAKALDAGDGFSLEELASRVAGGLSLHEAVVEASAVRLWGAPTSASYKVPLGNNLRRLAEKAAIRLAVDTLRKDGPRLIATLTAAYEHAQDEAAKLPPQINKVGSAEQAIEAGPKVAAAWPRYLDLQERHGSLVNVGRVLRRYRVFETDPPVRYLFEPVKETAA